MRKILVASVVLLLAGCGGGDTERYTVDSGAMAPGIQAGAIVTARKVEPGRYEPRRGDVVVFRAPDSWADTAGQNLVKRVVATGGQTIACCDPAGKVVVGGAALDEPYLGDNAPVDVPAGQCGSRRFGPVAVPAGQVFLLGDTRLLSADSACHGPVPVSAVIGVVDPSPSRS